MFSTIFRRAMIAVVVGASLVSGTSGMAIARDGGVPADAAASIQRLKVTGGLTDADRETLRKYPELAAAVVDPEAAVSEVTTRPDEARAAAIGAQACWITEAYFRATTVLGFTFYKFHHRADWCQNGSSVTGVHFRSNWNSEVDSQAKWIGLESDWVSPTPSWEVKSFKKGQFDNCIPRLGCISSTHPWVELTMRGDGYWNYATGQN